MYVRCDLKVKVLFSSDSLYSNKPELLFLEVRAKDKRLLLGVVYRPPHCGNLDTIEEVLSRFAPAYSDVIVMGDFNAPQADTGRWDVRQLQNTFNTFNLNVLPTGPTCHVTRAGRESHTTLDLMVTTQAKVLNHGQFSVDYISFHDLIFLSYSLKTPKFRPKFLVTRDLKSLDDVTLLAEAALSPWGTIRDLPDVNSKVEEFNNLVVDLLDRLAPEKQIRVTRPPAPWMTETIKDLKPRGKQHLGNGRGQRQNRTDRCTTY